MSDYNHITFLAAGTPGVSRGSGLVSLLGMLAATILILYLAWRASRWIAARGVPSGAGMGWLSADFFRSGAAENFRVLYQIPLGRTERLILLQAGAAYCCLLGVTESRITLLKEWTGDDADAWARAFPVQETSGPAFTDILKDLTGRAGKKSKS